MDLPQTPPALSIVVPLHNEADNVAPLQKQIAHALAERNFELILVDDGSSDDTVKRITREDNVRLITHAENLGQSAALYHGLWAADAPLIATLDGDLQNDPADLPRLIAQIDGGADMACGFRRNRQDSLAKRLQGRLANRLRRLITRDGIRDSGCSIRVMRRECREALVLFDGMHRFLPTMVRAAGFTIVEIPVAHRPRRHGLSHYGFANRAVRGIVDLIGVRWLLSRRRTLFSKHSS